MSRRIAHRPRYRSMRQLVQFPRHGHQNIFRAGWTYRRQAISYEKHELGYGLTHIPIRYRLMQHIIVHQAG